jgi:hypothetical protein
LFILGNQRCVIEITARRHRATELRHASLLPFWFPADRQPVIPFLRASSNDPPIFMVPAVWIEHTTYRLQGGHRPISPHRRTLQKTGVNP